MSGHLCGYMLRGPKRGRIFVYDQRPCRRPVKNRGDRCWQHVERRTNERDAS